MSEVSSVDAIRAQMSRIRARARRKASKVGAETMLFLDWRHYVRRYPWAVVGLAAAVGYWLAPRRQRPVKLHPQTFTALKNAQAEAVAQKIRPSWTGLAMKVARDAIVKAGTNYAIQYFMRAAAEGANGADGGRQPESFTQERTYERRYQPCQ